MKHYQITLLVVKSNYGNDQAYIIDEEIASCISSLTGRKTLTHTDQNALVQLGFTFNQVLPPKNK